VLANRDYYMQVSDAAQTSATSPFNGASGTGYGTLANRPANCTTGVGYWATDQGNWNTFNTNEEGELFTCTATNTWNLKYTPYTYPHPLEAGGTIVTNQPPNPSNLTATVQ
jgi:Flp pilus assembly protein TadG